MIARVQLKKRNLVVYLKGIGTKKNWLAANRQSWSNSDFDFDFDFDLSWETAAIQRGEEPLNMEADESSVLEAVSKQRLVKTQ
jgi:hypothetical protein